MFCWEPLGPGIHVGVTLTCTTFLQTKHTPYGNSNPQSQQDNVHFSKAGTVQKQLEEHVKIAQSVGSGLQNYPDPNPINHILDALEQA